MQGVDWKRHSNADQKSSELAREKMWSRIHLIPVLQAEEDRDLVRRHWAQEAREKELLGAETKVYNNDRCVLALYRSSGAPKEIYMYRQLTAETGSCVLRTRSLPARPRSRARRVRRAGRERSRTVERGNVML
jgi:NADH dehydrogenase (ubiquinone) 1 alpha subcomplex subunit 13